MKRFSLIAVAFIFTALFTVSAMGQAAQPGANAKIVVINTAAFDAKDGITKYANAMDVLDKEIAPLGAEIQTLTTKWNALGIELKKIQDSINVPNGPPIDQNSAQTKAEEYRNLDLTIKRKQEDGKRRVELRQSQILGPILQDIGKAMDEFAKLKGYDLILDATKLEGAGLILAVLPTKVDVTKEFVTFYNARPAGTATAAKPQ